MLFPALVFGAFGLIIGSFLNVLVLRKDVMPLTGRSQCPSCGTMIAWYDNIPVFSWLFLRGRCRHCGSAISMQYPIVEAITAILFAIIGVAAFPENVLYLHSALEFILEIVIVSLLIAIAVYDFRHTIIPDEWVYTFAALAFLLLLSKNQSVQTLIAGPAAAAPLFILWLISKGRWMGLGDPKLALGIGWLLGFPHGVIAIFASFILGSLVLVPLMLAKSIVTHMQWGIKGGAGLTMKSEVPFGPFLIATCILLWFFELYGVSIPLYLLGL